MDPVTGTHAAFAIQIALEHRSRSSEGVLLEMPQFTSGMNICAEQVLEYSSTGRILTRMGNRSWTVAPQGTYRGRDAQRALPDAAPDDWVAISVEDQEQWLGLCRAIGADHLAKDHSLR